MLITDREKVIRGLEVCSTVDDLAPCPNECPYNKPDAVCYGTARLMQDALALLREQEPVSVGFTNGVYHCGNCGEPLFDNNIYCHRCGRKVEWGDDGDA